MKYLVQDGSTNQYSVMIPLGTKDLEKAKEKANYYLEDIRNCVSCTTRSKIHADSPEFLKNIDKLDKVVHRVLKAFYR
jgi:hypothetical protein